MLGINALAGYLIMSENPPKRYKRVPPADVWGPKDYNETRLKIRMQEAAQADDAARVADLLAITSMPHCIVTAEALCLDALVDAVSHDSLKVLECLLAYGLDVNQVMPRDFSLPMAEILLEHSWDINCTKPLDHNRPRGPLLWQYVMDDEKVQWCLERGARVICPDSTTAQCPCRSVYCWPLPPLLTVAAQCSTVETFDRLRAVGAPLGESTLHKAVEACYMDIKADPIAAEVNEERTEDERQTAARERARFARRQAMVRYLVEDLALDVNAHYQPEKEMMYNRAGKPLAFIAQRPTGAVRSTPRDYTWVVHYLLDHGADAAYAESIAREAQGEDGISRHHFLDVVAHWRKQRKKDEKAHSSGPETVGRELAG